MHNRTSSSVNHRDNILEEQGIYLNIINNNNIWRMLYFLTVWPHSWNLFRKFFLCWNTQMLDLVLLLQGPVSGKSGFHLWNGEQTFDVMIKQDLQDSYRFFWILFTPTSIIHSTLLPQVVYVVLIISCETGGGYCISVLIHILPDFHNILYSLESDKKDVKFKVA